MKCQITKSTTTRLSQEIISHLSSNPLTPCYTMNLLLLNKIATSIYFLPPPSQGWGRYCFHRGVLVLLKFCWRAHIASYWWLVRVTLVVDWLFLPQNFGPVVGTYEGLLQLCECIWDGGSICRWWGHLTTIGGNRSFFCHRWWGP